MINGLLVTTTETGPYFTGEINGMPAFTRKAYQFMGAVVVGQDADTGRNGQVEGRQAEKWRNW
jgi:hypothetical protein